MFVPQCANLNVLMGVKMDNLQARIFVIVGAAVILVYGMTLPVHWAFLFGLASGTMIVCAFAPLLSPNE